MKLLIAAALALALLVMPAAAQTTADLLASPLVAPSALTKAQAVVAPATSGQTVTVQTAPASPVGTPAAAGATTTTITTAPPEVKIPWGDWLDAAINQIVVPLLGVVVLAGLTWLGALLAPLLPPALRGFVNAKNTAALEQLIVPALATGLKSVGTTVSGQAVNIPVQSQAVATAADYAVAHGSAQLVKWAGGPEGIRQKIEARLAMLTTGVTPATATTVAAPVAVAKPPAA